MQHLVLDNNDHQPPDRLDWIEASLAETVQLTQSNARAIQALGDDITTLRLTLAESAQQAQEERSELRRATLGIARRRQTNSSQEAELY